MDLNNMFAVISIFLGLFGTYSMARGLLSLQPLEILKSHPSHTSIIHSLDEITDIVASRVNNNKGILYILCGVIIQIGTLFSSDTQKNTILGLEHYIYVILCIFILFFVIENGSKKLITIKAIEANKYYLRKKINKLPIRDGGITASDQEFIKSCAEHYFGLFQKEEESVPEFLNRIADFVGANRIC